jgi:hypothetical protein
MHPPPHLGLMTAEEVAHVNATSGGVFGRVLFDFWRRTGLVNTFNRTQRAVYLIQARACYAHKGVKPRCTVQ